MGKLSSPVLDRNSVDYRAKKSPSEMLGPVENLLVEKRIYQFFDFQPAFALGLPEAAGAVAARLKLPKVVGCPESRFNFAGSW